MQTPRRHVVPGATQLWLITIVPPFLWATHFLAGYAISELGCKNFFLAPSVAGFNGTSVAILVLTLLMVVLMAWNGWRAYRTQTLSQQENPSSYRAFMGSLGMASSFVFGITVLVTGFAGFAAQTCP
jgi:hypothetical protein